MQYCSLFPIESFAICLIYGLAFQMYLLTLLDIASRINIFNLDQVNEREIFILLMGQIGRHNMLIIHELTTTNKSKR